MSSRDACINESALFTSVTFRKPEKSATTFPWVSIAPFGFPERRRQEGELVGGPRATPRTCPSQQPRHAIHLSLWPRPQPLGSPRQMNVVSGTFVLQMHKAYMETSSSLGAEGTGGWLKA